MSLSPSRFAPGIFAKRSCILHDLLKRQEIKIKIKIHTSRGFHLVYFFCQHSPTTPENFCAVIVKLKMKEFEWELKVCLFLQKSCYFAKKKVSAMSAKTFTFLLLFDSANEKLQLRTIQHNARRLFRWFLAKKKLHFFAKKKNEIIRRSPSVSCRVAICERRRGKELNYYFC